MDLHSSRDSLGKCTAILRTHVCGHFGKTIPVAKLWDTLNEFTFCKQNYVRRGKGYSEENIESSVDNFEKSVLPVCLTAF